MYNGKEFYKSYTLFIISKIQDYFQLIKFTLSFTVVFTCVICYLLAPNIKTFDFVDVVILFVAGMLITGSANAINQVVEKDTDALMKRTAKRPIASGRMSQKEGIRFAYVSGIVGVLMMFVHFNLASACISLFSLFLYAYIYTPLKKVNSIAVLVGALPGALPCLIGWVAATNLFNPFDDISIKEASIPNLVGWSLFALQFIWQFPHFWAIAWVAHTDYNNAGFKLLPSKGGPTKFTALQTIMYSFLLIPIGLLPYFYHLTGIFSMWIILIGNCVMVIQSIRLYIKMDVRSAKRVMFTSYFYLPLAFLFLLFDKLKF